MLEYLKGTLAEATPNKITVEINNMGYALLIPLSLYAKLPQIGHAVQIFVSTVIREDSQKQYGFLTAKERDLFEKITEVTGIGPKTALALIGHMEWSELSLAISQSNTHLICKVPGIGKKTAERLIIELRDKLKSFDQKDFPSLLCFASEKTAGTFSDAMSALVNLGYPTAQAQAALKKAIDTFEAKEPKLAELITSALRQM